MSAALRRLILRKPKGTPFASRDVLHLGSRAVIDQTLSRMVKAGEIVRLARGIYVAPRSNPHVGVVPPSTATIVETIARVAGETVAPHGAEAARRLGLSTQAPVQPIFLTSGRSRAVGVGGKRVALRHVAPRKLTMAGTPAGLALSALWYLGKNAVTVQTIAHLKSRLSPASFGNLNRARAAMPGWLAVQFAAFERSSSSKK